ncbi:signal peptidase I [Paenarthrobacter sp. Z7-10]|uniref:signal peptidase I n=1 Tax=Paenarthrobacter sp. Z7-10 TaxID=2787635 RepID=UPI0022A96C70|nr:signal peptidase I [Paenarthrobacter sp. Z7-10]MCZ2403875.1 signal peptidase I [Paenarthrobacter sp. Z7-10]
MPQNTPGPLGEGTPHGPRHAASDSLEQEPGARSPLPAQDDDGGTGIRSDAPAGASTVADGPEGASAATGAEGAAGTSTADGGTGSSAADGGAGSSAADGGAGGSDGGTGTLAADGAAGADGAAAKFGKGALSWLKEVGTIVLIALVLSFLIKTFLFRAYWIPSGSMENTLELNDRIFVNLLVPQPFALQRGDIVVFKDSQGWLGPEAAPKPAGPFSWVKDAFMFVGLVPDDSQQHLVKRVIGLPGDTVICCDTSGRLTVNGTSLTEPYLFPGAVPSEQRFDVTVPDGKLWVMGDHRNNSADSRAHMSTPGRGFVPISDVEGRATVIAWPISRWTFLGNYHDVFGPVPAPSPHSTGSPSAVPTGQ